MKRSTSIILTILLLSIFCISNTYADEADSWDVRKASAKISINGQHLPSYFLGEDLAICAEDLKNCGFTGIWDSMTRKCYFDYTGVVNSIEDKEDTSLNVGDKAFITDIQLLINGQNFRCYSTDGYLLVKLKDLQSFYTIKDNNYIEIKMDGANLANEVKFEDIALEKLIREELQQFKGALYDSNLRLIEKIYDKGIDELENFGFNRYQKHENITNLSNIHKLNNLEQLILEKELKSEELNKISNLKNLKKLSIKVPVEYSLELLSRMPRLEMLEIETINSVEKIQTLSNLKELKVKTTAYNLEKLQNLEHLEKLDIEILNTSNKEVLKFLQGMKHLKSLSITCNILEEDLNIQYLNHIDADELEINTFIPDDKYKATIKYLSSIENLTSLNINADIIEDINFLKDMNQLRYINIHGDKNQLDLKPLSYLSNLEKLHITDQNVDDLSFLRDKKKLKDLRIGPKWYVSQNEAKNKQAKGINYLAKLENLEALRLIDIGLSNIDWIKSLKDLKYVNLAHNNIEDVEALSYLNNIEELDLSFNDISNVQPILTPNSNMNLKVLSLAGNKLQSIKFSKRLPSLKVLSLYSNRLSNIEGIDNILYLKSLIIGRNSFNDISFITRLKRLEELDISENTINTLKDIQNLDKIKALSIANISIDDYTPLYELQTLTELTMDDLQSAKLISDKSDFFFKLSNLESVHIYTGESVRMYFRSVYNQVINNTFKGNIILDESVDELPKDGVILLIKDIYVGKYNNSIENTIEIPITERIDVIPYEFNQEHRDSFWRTKGKDVEIDTNNKYYIARPTKEYITNNKTKNPIIDGMDIIISKAVKVSGRLSLSEDILNSCKSMNEYDRKNYDYREVVVRLWIGDEVYETVASLDLDKNIVDYELYIPKRYAGKKYKLEVRVKDYGFYGSRAHIGTVGSIIVAGFIDNTSYPTPDIDEAKEYILKDTDQVIDDISIEMHK